MKDKQKLEIRLKVEMLKLCDVTITPVNLFEKRKDEIQTEYDLSDKEFTLRHYELQLQVYGVKLE